jgi:hypothetical protein
MPAYFLHIQPAVFQATDKAVILRACDFFDFSVLLHTNQMFSTLLHKAVILSGAPRRSIAYRGVYRAESKDLGDARWQMLLGAFRPQTTTEDKTCVGTCRFFLILPLI